VKSPGDAKACLPGGRVAGEFEGERAPGQFPDLKEQNFGKWI
jgi:hypothetical protein